MLSCNNSVTPQCIGGKIESIKEFLWRIKSSENKILVECLNRTLAICVIKILVIWFYISV